MLNIIYHVAAPVSRGSSCRRQKEVAFCAFCDIMIENRNAGIWLELQRMKTKLLRNIKLDYISVFITNLNMQGCIWVLYLTYCNMTLLQIGLLEGIYHIASMLCEIPSGAWADLVGRKRSMLISRLCITISCVIMLFSRSFWGFALSFTIQALGNSFTSGSEEALVYDSMKCIGQEADFIKVNGRLNTLIEVSQSIATVAGGILAEYSYAWCYGACVVIALLSLGPVSFMTEPPIFEVQTERLGGLARVRHHFKVSCQILRNDARIMRIIGFYSLVFAAHTLLFYYSQQYFYDSGYNKIQISIVFLFAGIVSCLGALSSSYLYRKFKDKIATFGALVIALTMVCYGLCIPLLSMTVFVISSFFNAALYPVESECLNRLIPSAQRATLISVNSMTFSVMMIMMFPVAGFLADIWTLPVVLMGLGFFVLLATMLLKQNKQA